MKETIEAWARCSGSRVQVYACEVDARKDALTVGGTVVKLTGEMPRKPIERKTTAWVNIGNPLENCATPEGRLGIFDSWVHKTDLCQTKVEIIVREVQE